MEVTTFDFGDVCIGTVEDDDREVDAVGVVRFGPQAILQLNEHATGRLDRLKDLESGFVTFVGADGLDLSDADYRAIASLPGLRSVDFDNTRINADQIGYFCHGGVKAFNLAEALTDAAMPAIASVSGLVHLFASRSSVTDAGLAYLRGHDALEAVHLSSTGVTAASADVIASLPALTTLEMSGATDDVLRAAAREHLRRVHLRYGVVTEAGIRALTVCSSLAVLGLIETTLVDSACRALGELNSLETLFLNLSTFDDEALRSGLTSMVGLYAVNLRNTPAGDTVLAGLSDLPALATVHAVNTNVTDKGVALLAKVGTLRSIDFEGTAVTPDGLAQLTQLPKPFELG